MKLLQTSPTRLGAENWGFCQAPWGVGSHCCPGAPLGRTLPSESPSCTCWAHNFYSSDLPGFLMKRSASCPWSACCDLPFLSGSPCRSKCSFPVSLPSRPLCVVVSLFTEPSRIPPLPTPLGLRTVLFEDYSCVLGPAGPPQVAGCGQAVLWSGWPAWSPAGTVVESTKLPRTHSVLSGEAGWRRTHSHS